MDEKFPYGYDVNAYIDKAFEQMKTDFPWATREMIAEHTYYGIAKVGNDYQYVACAHGHIGTEAVPPSYWRQFDGREGKAPHRGLSSKTGVSQRVCHCVVSWLSHEVVVVGE